MNQKRGWWRLAVGTAVVALTLGMAAPTGAQTSIGSAEVDELAAKGYSWQGWADARAVAPLAGLPHEQEPTSGFARSYVDSVPGSSVAFAAFLYGDEIVEEGIIELAPGGETKNPAVSRCGNPGEHGAGNTIEFGGGGGGGNAVTDCGSQLAATGQSTYGPLVTDGLSVGSISADAKSQMSEGLIVGEALSRLEGIKAGDLSIDSLMSWVKVEYPANEEPKISYQISALGVRNGKDTAIGFGSPSWTLGGSDVPASELVTQFNAQANEVGATASPEQQTWEIDLMAPRVYEPGDVPGRSFTDYSPINKNEILVSGAFLRIRTNNYQCCKNATLENTGFNLALARVRNYIAKTDDSIGDKVLDGGYEADDKSPINTGVDKAPKEQAEPAAAPAVYATLARPVTVRVLAATLAARGMRRADY
jgi:hypothetical protein